MNKHHFLSVYLLREENTQKRQKILISLINKTMKLRSLPQKNILFPFHQEVINFNYGVLLEEAQMIVNQEKVVSFQEQQKYYDKQNLLFLLKEKEMVSLIHV